VQPVDLSSQACRKLGFFPQMRSQPFADFSADCPGVGVINLNAVAHSGTFVPVNPPTDGRAHSHAFCLTKFPAAPSAVRDPPTMKTGTVAFGYLARALALNSGSVRGTFGYPRHAPLLTAGDGLSLTTPILEKCSKVNSRELSDWISQLIRRSDRTGAQRVR
jgi:hypothetical protein